jgi:DNA-binding winged helix-turn-helix (wHTH) protein/tetratricopeptide (TPR) repeat protein
VEEGVSYRFAGFSLDAARLELRAPGGERVEASAGAIELLLHLIRHRERIVTKEELSKRLWPNVVVNENALAQHIWAVRKAVGDAGSEQRLIKNVRGRGYRFVADVDEVRISAASGPVAPPNAEFVGREEELAWASRCFQDALSGNGRVGLISGDAGIGKTRLLQELRRVAVQLGFHENEGRCHDDEAMPPFWPWKDALANVERRLDLDALRRAVAQDGADLSRLIPALNRRLGSWSPPPARETDDDRYYLFQAAAEFLVCAAAEAPVLITLDDLHWADLPSLRLLKFLAPYIGASRIVVMATYRGNELPESHRRLLEGTARQACVQRRTLEGLDVAAAAKLLARSGLRIETEELERIFVLTAGNPLFIAELEAFRENNLEVGSPAAAEGLYQALARRVSRLQSSCQAVARVAAVLGHDFRLADLKRVTGQVDQNIAATLELLIEQRIVVPDPEHVATYRFTHSLVRETIYRGIGASERARLHRAVAEALERLLPDQGPTRMGEIAHHYHAAIPSGTASKAAKYAGLVAERAYAGAAFEESVRLYRRGLEALELCDSPDESYRNRLLLGLGHALRGASEEAAVVRASFAQVAENALRTGDAAVYAEAALGYAGHDSVRTHQLTEMGVVDNDEVAYLTRANEMLGPTDSVKKSMILALLARALYHSTDVKRRDETARDSVAMARRLQEPHLIARTLLIKQQVLRTPDLLDERISDLSEVIEIADAIGARELQIDARHERAWAYVQLARMDKAEADIHRIGRLADELRQPSERRLVELWELSWAYLREPVDQVEGRDLARFMQRRTAKTSQAYGIRLLMTRYVQDRAAETIPLLESFAQQFPLPGSWHCALASTYATVGRMEDSHQQLEAVAASGYSAVPRTHDWLASFAYAANAAQLLKDKARARELRDVLAPFENQVIVLGVGNCIGGQVARTLGDLHRLLGDGDEAERCYKKALETAATMKLPMLVAWTQVELAQLYLRCDGYRDRHRAEALLHEAAPAIEQLGLALLRRRAGDLSTELHSAFETFELTVRPGNDQALHPRTDSGSRVSRSEPDAGAPPAGGARGRGRGPTRR